MTKQLYSAPLTRVVGVCNDQVLAYSAGKNGWQDGRGITTDGKSITGGDATSAHSKIWINE